RWSRGCSSSARLTWDVSSELHSGSAPSLEKSGFRQSSISVVIPTRDRPMSLRRCLGALAEQLPLEDLEVIVVDDGSADRPAGAEVVRRVRFCAPRPPEFGSGQSS